VHVLADASSKFVDAIAGVELSNLDQESLEKLHEFWTENDQQRVTQAQNISAWCRRPARSQRGFSNDRHRRASW
jgi:hypothetical protein